MKVGIDWGGTKIEAIVLDPSTGKELLRKRVDAPKENYVEIINTAVSYTHLTLPTILLV